LNRALAIWSKFMEYEQDYRLYIERLGVGAKDTVASSVDSYVSYLKSVESYLNIEINPASLSNKSQEIDIVRKLIQLNVVTKKTVSNYRSAMRQYSNMVENLNLERDENYYLSSYELNDQLKSSLFSVLQELQMTEVILIDCILLGYSIIQQRTKGVLDFTFKETDIQRKGLNALGTLYCSLFGDELKRDIKQIADIRNNIAHRYAYEHFSQSMNSEKSLNKAEIVDKTVQLLSDKAKAHSLNSKLLSNLKRAKSELDS
ncbi:hypothetical protein, partial [Vibrio parahaemolyticus]|uniref:hypothetical protein n=1 Tax=Vibrio parahaemolyticus TaxID=670 RepID=UPI0022B5CA7A